ncbi:hypothetical protein B5F25_07580 [Bacteroides sp. An19]|nr:hypothetical protein B5F25_07580 [Bacteroides sp. An19]
MSSIHLGECLDYIIGADSILLWFPNQNRTFLVRKPYGFGTENVKCRLLEADCNAFNQALVHILPNKFVRGNEKTLP